MAKTIRPQHETFDIFNQMLNDFIVLLLNGLIFEEKIVSLLKFIPLNLVRNQKLQIKIL